MIGQRILTDMRRKRRKAGAGLLGLDLPRTAETHSTVAGTSLNGYGTEITEVGFPGIARSGQYGGLQSKTGYRGSTPSGAQR